MAETIPHTTPTRPRSLAWGFLAGALSVLIFHQAMLGFLHVVGVTPGTPWRLTPTAPLGVPTVLSAAFWGGLWGCVFVLVRRRFPHGPVHWLGAFVFGAIGPTLVAWFVVLPLKGVPIGGRWHPAGLLTGLLVNGAWGVGTAVFLAALDRRTIRSRAER